MNFSALINHLLESYPYSYGCEWDNFGPQVGDYEKTINKILVPQVIFTIVSRPKMPTLIYIRVCPQIL